MIDSLQMMHLIKSTLEIMDVVTDMLSGVFSKK